VHKGTGTVDSTDNVRHTGLVSTEGGEVGSISGLVLGVGSDLTRVLLGSLLGEETQVTLSGCFKFSVRPVCAFQVQRKRDERGSAIVAEGILFTTAPLSFSSVALR
jgi:hypothetical protein